MKRYVALRMRFQARVPSDKGKQVDFSGGDRPIIDEQLNEWMALGVVRVVDR